MEHGQDGYKMSLEKKRQRVSNSNKNKGFKWKKRAFISK